jgi:hypothetical protein
MIDRIERAATAVLVTMVSLAALSLAVWHFFADPDPLGINGLFTVNLDD